MLFGSLSEEYPSGVCSRGVGVDSVLCTKCGKWIQLRYSGLQFVTQARDYDYFCPTSTRCRQGYSTMSTQVDDTIVLGPAKTEVVEEVESLCYLGSIAGRECGVESSSC